MSDEKKRAGVVEGAPGRNELCLPASGEYEITVDSCYRYEPPTQRLVVPGDKEVRLTPLSALISGSIKSVDKEPSFSILIKYFFLVLRGEMPFLF